MEFIEAFDFYSLDTVRTGISQLSPLCITVSVAWIIGIAISRLELRLFLDRCENYDIEGVPRAMIYNNLIEGRLFYTIDPQISAIVIRNWQSALLRQFDSEKHPSAGRNLEQDYARLIDSLIDKLIDELMNLDALLSDSGLEAISEMNRIPTVDEAVEILTSFFSNF